MKKKCAVLIFAYLQNPSESEQASFRQCLKILNNYDIYVIHPESLLLDTYVKIAKELQVRTLYKPCADDYFKSINSYNKLMLSSFFYEKFSSYEYVLIYQLDAWVFKDELDYWCDQGYSYIGAPWFEGFTTANEESIMLEYSGNGGFSLRHVRSFIKLLNMKLSIRYLTAGKKISKKSYVSFILYYLKQKPSISEFFMMTSLYEDWLYVNYANMIYSDFKRAPAQIALSFSFEVNPRILYMKNNYELPFGCHAFERYQPEFWQDKIDFFKSKKC